MKQRNIKEFMLDLCKNLTKSTEVIQLVTIIDDKIDQILKDYLFDKGLETRKLA